jgi:hypothetical protein
MLILQIFGFVVGVLMVRDMLREWSDASYVRAQAGSDSPLGY